MYIEHIDIKGFGCLQGRIDFAVDRLNLVLAPNEAGKSTLAAAVVAALFDLETDKRKKGADNYYERFQPWGGLPFRIAARFIKAGEPVTVERGFGKEDSFAVFDASGKDITKTFQPQRGRDTFGETLTGMPEPGFRRVAFMDQMQQDPNSGAEEAVKMLHRNADTGGDASAQDAIATLNQALDQYQGVTVQGRQVDTEIRRLNIEIEKKISRLRELDGLRDSILEPVSRLSEIEQGLESARGRREKLALEIKAAEAAGIKSRIEKNKKLRGQREEILKDQELLKDCKDTPEELLPPLREAVVRIEESGATAAELELGLQTRTEDLKAFRLNGEKRFAGLQLPAEPALNELRGHIFALRDLEEKTNAAALSKDKKMEPGGAAGEYEGAKAGIEKARNGIKLHKSLALVCIMAGLIVLLGSLFKPWPVLWVLGPVAVMAGIFYLLLGPARGLKKNLEELERKSKNLAQAEELERGLAALGLELEQKLLGAKELLVSLGFKTAGDKFSYADTAAGLGLIEDFAVWSRELARLESARADMEREKAKVRTILEQRKNEFKSLLQRARMDPDSFQDPRQALELFTASVEKSHKYLDLGRELKRIEEQIQPDRKISAMMSRLSELEARGRDSGDEHNLDETDLRRLDAEADGEQTRLARERDQIRNRMERDLVVLETERPKVLDELEELQSALTRAVKFQDSALEARDLLSRLSREGYASWSQRLGAASDSILSNLQPRGRKIEFAEDLTFSVIEPDGRRIAFEDLRRSLSAGALDQVLLTVRMALAQAVGSPADGVPVLLDDPLARADDPRFCAGFRFLAEMAAAGRQLIVFSCHQARHWSLRDSDPDWYHERVNEISLEKLE